MTGEKVLNNIPELSAGPLQYEEVLKNFQLALNEVARVYAKAMYIIHYMHDKYYYEKAQMAFIDTDYQVDIAYGIAGLSIVADSLSAIKHAQVSAVRNDQGITTEFKIEGEYPMFGNDDDRVDTLAQETSKYIFEQLKTHK